MGLDAPLHDVIQDLEPTDITVGKLARDRGNKHPDLYAKFLMACEGDQVHFLMHLYADYFAQDLDILTTWHALIKNGFLVDLLNPEDTKAQDLIRAVQFAIMRTKDRLGDTPNERPRNRRRN